MMVVVMAALEPYIPIHKALIRERLQLGLYYKTKRQTVRYYFSIVHICCKKIIPASLLKNYIYSFVYIFERAWWGHPYCVLLYRTEGWEKLMICSTIIQLIKSFHRNIFGREYQVKEQAYHHSSSLHQATWNGGRNELLTREA